ncbi:MAG: biotin synthase BioB [Nitrospirota bacterium]
MSASLRKTIDSTTDKILSGGRIDLAEALALSRAAGTDLTDLIASSCRIKEYYRGSSVDICSIVNAKSGACGEDCRFCAQSSHYSTDAPVYPLIDVDRMEEAAREAKKNGARRFCIVTSGRGIDDDTDLRSIARGVERVNAAGLSPCATLGTLTHDQLRYLKDAGLHRYHHNIETSREFFPNICTTHTFDERTDLLHHAHSIGLSACSGGILGMGETMRDRVSMAFSLKELGVESVPINFLMPIAGTPMDRVTPIVPLEALHAIALFRMILPDREIRVCGGRGTALADHHPRIFQAGADGFMIGNYLTRTGLDPESDLRMLTDLGLSIRPA